MENEQLKEKITALIPEAVFEDGQWLNVLIGSDRWRELAQELRSKEDFRFDYLFCVTCVDWKTHFSMVYHLSSAELNHILVVKAKITDHDLPVIDTVCDLWRTAELHEREAYDLFGVKFNNHPDLRRLLMTDEWIGWPLRKDYEDPVNMIKL
jgi:NADH:ubiquinone oxidoreductase subunit C